MRSLDTHLQKHLHWCREFERETSVTRFADMSHRVGFMQCPQGRYPADARRQLPESQVIICPSRAKRRMYHALGLEMPDVEEKGVEKPVYLYSFCEDRWLCMVLKEKFLIFPILFFKISHLWQQARLTGLTGEAWQCRWCFPRKMATDWRREHWPLHSTWYPAL